MEQTSVNIDSEGEKYTTVYHTWGYISQNSYQLISLKRLLTMIILHMPSNIVLLHPCPLMHGPPLLHLSLFLPVTQHVSDSQSLFNFVIFPISFSLLFCPLDKFLYLGLAAAFPLSVFIQILICSPPSLSSSGPQWLGLLHIHPLYLPVRY